MVLGRPNLGRILVQRGIVTDGQLEEALQYQLSKGCRLGEALVGLGLCFDTEIAQALAEQLEIPFVDLRETPALPDCVGLITREIALEYGVLPVRMQGNRLLVVARDPFDIRIDAALRQLVDRPVILAIAPESQLQELLDQCYSEPKLAVVRPLAHKESVPEEAEDDTDVSLESFAAGDQISTVLVVNGLISDAVRRGASDIHIEPESGRVRVRYRIDGRLRSVVTLQRDILQSVVSRVKVMCGMDISESRKPQDGCCCVRVDSREIELRGSTLRGIYGEIVVLRILTHESGLHRMETLGLEPTVLRDFRRLLASRQGMILIAGPTGSGKTTTLYAALSHLNREDINIITVEDPVEVKLPGINQIQVHDRAGRTFATTLRSMLRQDPDVIMVGEIRDVETVEIACRAALTGHLVLSTVHTQHALSTVARLFDMGVAPWMITACLNGVMAQRLVRRVCESCAVDYTPPAELQRALEGQFGSLEDARFRRGKGCPVCHGTGARGRIGVYELLAIDAHLRHLLSEETTYDRLKLREHIVQRGFRSFEEDAFHKACRGLVAPEEVVNLGFEVARALEEGGEDAADVTEEQPADGSPSPGSAQPRLFPLGSVSGPAEPA